MELIPCFPSDSDGKELACNEGDLDSIPGGGGGHGKPPEEGMATHSRILAWRNPWTEESDGLQPAAAGGGGGHKDLACTYIQ